MNSGLRCSIVPPATQALLRRVNRIIESASSPFEAAGQLARLLGVHYRDGVAEVGFWVPDLVDQAAYLQIERPVGPIHLEQQEQVVRFERQRVRLVRQGEFAWGVIEGARPGRRDQVGDFYCLVYQDEHQAWHTMYDPLAYSVPFGAFSPAEFYDIEGMLAQRADLNYFRDLAMEPDPDGVPRVRGPVNILQIHVGTASVGRTLASLTQRYQAIGAKIEWDEALKPAEQTYVGYDAVQLMPIEPTIEYEVGPPFWQAESAEEDDDLVTVRLRRPDVTNWGYDVALAASPAVNPVLLGSGRPDEFLDFVVAMHRFPGRPIKVILDIVYGHADNQSLALLNRDFFAGPGMYGQVLDYRRPVVRAILLEMQRRKSNYGVDGIRVDGAQDFKYWDPGQERLVHDDAYLREMNDLVLEVGDQRYRPWMIFEDGRPWPREDWELASTYREVTKQLPNVVQWGPLTFAHNTPFLFTFWASKMWRVRELMEVGDSWITGYANHDTLRRGTQVDPQSRINTFLGDTLLEIFRNGYDSVAANLFTYAFSPGVPMDFINASMRAPWSFIRNTDSRYAVKVVSEEARFLDWAVDDARYDRSENFVRLKALGFGSLVQLRRFMRALDHTVQATEGQTEIVARLLNGYQPPLAAEEFSEARLREIARAWMDDLYDYCNVALYGAALEPERTNDNLAVREFRRDRPWLRAKLGPADHFNYLHPTDGAVLFYGLRFSPQGDEQLLFVANMEGEPRSIVPTNLPIARLAQDGWQVALATPGLEVGAADTPLTLENNQGVVFVRS